MRPSTLVLVTVTLALLGGCSDDPQGDAPTAGAGGPETTTRSLVAAIEENLGRPAKLAAPLSRGDIDDRHPQSVAAGTLGVEVALDEEVGDNSHVRVVVTPDLGAWEDHACEELEVAAGCEETTTPDGAEQRLLWEAGTPEEDPGVVLVEVRRSDRVVLLTYYGEEVPKDLPDSDLAPLADDLVALAADPDVGFRTSQRYAEAGEEIDDQVMLDFYGQGNGAAPPPGYDEDGTGSAGGPSAATRPLTYRALAAAAVAHLGEAPVSVSPVWSRRATGPGSLAVRLVDEPFSGDDPWVYTVAVQPVTGDPYRCPTPLDEIGCDLVETDTGQAMLVWEDARAGESGVVRLVTVDGRWLSSVTLTGPQVAGDPRQSDLAAAADRMIELLLDPAVGRPTTRALVREGRRIPDDVWQEWDGETTGSPEPPRYDHSST